MHTSKIWTSLIKTFTFKASEPGPAQFGDQAGDAKRGRKMAAVEVAYESLKEYQVDRRRNVFTNSKHKRGGGYGMVQQADLYQSAYVPSYLATYVNGPPQTIAVKQMRMSALGDQLEVKRSFVKEILVWSKLGLHRGISQFLGFYADFENLEAWLLSPWEANGTVMDFIVQHQLEVPEKLSLIYDTIDALNFLHQLTPPICHGDVKSGLFGLDSLTNHQANVLINGSCRAVFSDFGLARLYEDSAFSRLETSAGFTGSIRWCSPELFNGVPRSPSSDLYAWAWLVWEILTGEMPYQDCPTDFLIIRKIFEGAGTPADGGTRLSGCILLWELMARCWSIEPEQRPRSSMCLTTVSCLPRCIPTPEVSNPGSPSAELLENRGALDIWKGAYDEASTYLERSLAMYKQQQDSKGIASVLRKQAEVAYRLDKYSDTRELASAALEELRTLEDELATADALVWLACSFDGEVRSDQGLPHFEEALRIFSAHDHVLGVSMCLERLGEISRRQGQYEKASSFLQEAIATASHSGDKVGEMRAIRTLGKVAGETEDLDKAITLLTTAVEISRHLGLQYTVCDTLSVLAQVKLEQMKYEDAEHLFLESIEIAQRTNQTVTLARSLAGLGKTCGDHGNITAARDILEESVLTFQMTSLRGVERIWVLWDLGMAKEALCDLEGALACYDQAISESQRLDWKEEFAISCSEKGRMLQEEGRYDEAGLYFEASLVVEHELGRVEVSRSLMEDLASLPMTAVRPVAYVH
ncbi:hypothetical protein FRB90_003005 [Tulasnella sp. 427]|nr:hypothetical protein FRB90_003005 [Tulasnella sp. 427]